MPNNFARVQCPYCPVTPAGVSAAKLHVKAKHRDLPTPETFAPVAVPSPHRPKSAKNASKNASKNSPKVHIITKEVQPDAHGNLTCPECPEVIPTHKDKPDYKRLGRHRRFAHNVVGHKWEPKNGPRGPYKKNGRVHSKGIVHVPQTNPVLQIAATAPQLVQHDDITLAYAIAVGSIKEFCRHFAEEHAVPTKLFTRSVSELFLREARR